MINVAHPVGKPDCLSSVCRTTMEGHGLEMIHKLRGVRSLVDEELVVGSVTIRHHAYLNGKQMYMTESMLILYV